MGRSCECVCVFLCFFFQFESHRVWYYSYIYAECGASVCSRKISLFLKKISQKKFFWRFQRILKGGEKLCVFQVFFSIFFNFFKVNSNWFSWRKSGLKQSWKRVFLVFKSNFCMSYLCFFWSESVSIRIPTVFFPIHSFIYVFQQPDVMFERTLFYYSESLLLTKTKYRQGYKTVIKNSRKMKIIKFRSEHSALMGASSFKKDRQTITVNHGESRKIIENQWKSMKNTETHYKSLKTIEKVLWTCLTVISSLFQLTFAPFLTKKK